MLEALLGLRNKVSEYDKYNTAPGAWNIDIHFERSQLGSYDVIDRGTLGATYTRSTKGSIAGLTGIGVIDDPKFGIGYNHGGVFSFLCNNGKLPGMLASDSVMEIGYIVRQQDGIGLRDIMATGTYAPSNVVRTGYHAILEQIPSHFQLFSVNAGTQYSRAIITGDSLQRDKFRRIKVEYKKSTNQWRVSDLETGLTGQWTQNYAVAETYLRLFTAHDANYTNYPYLLKYLRIKNLT